MATSNSREKLSKFFTSGDAIFLRCGNPYEVLHLKNTCLHYSMFNFFLIIHNYPQKVFLYPTVGQILANFLYDSKDLNFSTL